MNRRAEAIKESLRRWDADQIDLTEETARYQPQDVRMLSDTDKALWAPRPIRRMEQFELRSFQGLYWVMSVVTCAGLIAALLFAMASLRDTPAGTPLIQLGGLMISFQEAAVIFLFAIGFTTLLLHRNLVKKIIGFNIMNSAIGLFLFSMGAGGSLRPPLAESVAPQMGRSGPLPGGLALASLAVSVLVTALMLTLTLRLYRKYHTLNIDEICMHAQSERKV